MVSKRRSGGGSSRWIFGLLAMLAVAGATGWLAAGTNGRARGGMADETAATRYFRQLGTPPGAGAVVDFRAHDRDGMQNEDASGSYRIAASATAILDHYRQACRRIGLASPPSTETRTYYPAALCDGAVIVTIVPRCTGTGCTVFVEVTG